GKGREVTADDFVYSFKRIVDPSTASTGQWIFNGKVLFNTLGKLSDSSFVAVDKYTLKIKLQQPFPPFIKLLSMPYAYVVPKEAIEKYGKDFRSNPVGTGPFIFKSWEEGSSLILTKNQNYWKKDENGVNLPYLDAVQISFITDENMAFINFSQGKLDFLSGINENSRDMILDSDGNVKSEFSHQFKVQKLLYLNTEYLGFQMDSSKYEDKNHPLLNKKVRQALNYAIDKQEMVTFLRNGLGIPGEAGFVPHPILFKHKLRGYAYNPEKASNLLKEAGFFNKKVKLQLYTTAPYKQISEYLQKSWSKIGVEVEIIVNQNATHREMANNGILNFFRGSWVGDYVDEENYLAVFYGKNLSPAGPNKTRFVNKNFDLLYEQAITESDPDRREDIYLKMDKIIIDECPVIVLYYDELVRLAQNNVVGLETNPMNMLFLEKVNIKD
ncbi:MAG: ABC transporter substrate-binding protein, partial [Cytophagales bacterium]